MITCLSFPPPTTIISFLSSESLELRNPSAITQQPFVRDLILSRSDLDGKEKRIVLHV